MKKIKTIFAGLALVAIAVGLFFSCEIGLGQSVDTKAPSVTITSPAVNSVIAGTFTATGGASDDTSLKSVDLTFKETTTGASYGPYTASIDSSAHTWSCALNAKDSSGAFSIADGKYQITATATDGVGRTSVATTVYQIDNINPTVLITSPITYGTGNVTTFYKTIDIKGEVYDASTIKSVVVSILDPTSGAILASATADGTDTWSARFDYSSGNGPLSNNTTYNYNVVATDSAGNTNTYYFHRLDIYPKLAKNADGTVTFPSMYQIGRLDQGLTSQIDSVLTSGVLASLRHGTASTSTTQAYADFKFMASAASTVQWLNLSSDQATTAVIALDGSIVGSILPPSDGSSITASSVKFYVTNNTTGVKTVQPSSAVKLTAVGTSLNFEVTPVDGMGVNVRTGNYQIDISFTISSGSAGSDWRSFKVSAGAPIFYDDAAHTIRSATSKQTDIRASTAISGYLYKSDGVVLDTTGALTCKIDSGTATTVSVNSTTGSFTIPVTVDGTGHSTDGTHSYVLTAIDGDITSIVSRTFNVDTKVPEVQLNMNPSDSISGKYNGDVPIKGAITDDNMLTSVYWQVSTSSTVPSYDINAVRSGGTAGAGWTQLGSNLNVLNDTWHSSGFGKTGDATCYLWLIACDKFGNVSVGDNATTPSANLIMTVNQDTDKPKVSLTNVDVSASTVTSTVNCFGTTSNNKILGSVTDDDGLYSVTVTVKSSDGNTTVSTTTKDLSATKPTTYSLSYTLPETEGEYKVEISAIDSALHVSGSTGSFPVAVDAGAPCFSITSPAMGQYHQANESITVSGSVQDGSGAVTLSGVAPAQGPFTDSSTHSWTDTFTTEAITGSYSRTYTATDKYGNASNATFTYKVDKTAPSLAIATMAIGYYDAQLTVSGTASDNESGLQKVQFMVDANGNGLMDDTWVDATGKDSWYKNNIDSSALHEGLNTIWVRALDYQNNETIKSTTFTIDHNDPNLAIDTAFDGIVYKNAQFTINGNVNDTLGLASTPVTITVKKNSVPYSLTTPALSYNSATGAWSRDINISGSGSYELTITATDGVGRTKVATRTVTVDVTPPSVEIASFNSYVTGMKVNGTVSFNALASDANGIAGTKYFVTTSNTDPGYAASVNSPVSVVKVLADQTIDTTSLTDNTTYYLWVVAQDRAGNSGSVSMQFTVDQSTDKPVITFSNVGTGAEYGDSSKAGNNLIVSGGTIAGSITDDDGIGAATISIWNGVGHQVVTDAALTLTGASAKSKVFSYSVSALLDGAYYFKVVATDINTVPVASLDIGNTWFAYDTAEPVVTLDLKDTNSTTIGPYRNASFSVKGTVNDANGVISTEISYDNGSTWTTLSSGGTAGAGVTQTWTQAVPVTGNNGSKTIQVCATDTYGRKGFSVNKINVTLDDVAPATPTITSTAAAYVFSTLSVGGTASDATSGVKNVYYRIDGVAGDAATGLLTGANLWFGSPDISSDSLAQGSHMVYIWTEDNAGNKSAETGQSFMKDLDPPVIDETEIATTNTQYRINNTLFKGTASDTNLLSSVKVSIKKDGVAWIGDNAHEDLTAGMSGSQWTYTFPAAGLTAASDNGTYVLVFAATDAAHRTSTVTRTVVVDNIPPTVSLTTSLSDWKSSDFVISGSCGDTGGSGLSSVEYQLGASGSWVAASITGSSWSASLSLTGVGEGSIPLSIRATDRAGNPTTISNTVKIDLANPVVSETTVNSADTQYWNKSTGHTFDGKATDSNALSSLTVSINGAAASTIAVDADGLDGILGNADDGAWTYTFNAAVADGSYTLIFTATDAAGKTSTITRNVVVDNTDPTVSITPINGYQDGTVALLGGAIDANLTRVEYQLDATTEGSWTTASGSANWTGLVNMSAASESTHTLYYRAFDRAGNTSAIESTPILVDLANPRATETNYTSALIQRKTTVTFKGIADDAAITPGRAADSAILTYSKDGAAAVTVTPGSGANEFHLDNGTGEWSWIMPATIGDGLYTVTLTVTDKASKPAAVSRTVQMDTTGPTIVIGNPGSGSASTDSTINISGTSRDTGGVGFAGAAADAQYSLDSTDGINGTWTNLGSLAGSINWSATGVSLGASEGAKKIYIRSTDKVGNYSTAYVDFYYDKDPPTLTETTVHTTDTQYRNGDISFAGSVFDTNAMQSLTVKIGTSAEVPITLPAATTTGLSVTSVDTTADTLTVAGHGFANGDLVQLVGTVLPKDGSSASLLSDRVYYVVNETTDNFQIALTNGGSAIDLTSSGSGVIVRKANWSYVFDQASHSDGTYTLVFTATDAAKKTTSVTRTVMLDRSAPTVAYSASTTTALSSWQTKTAVTVSGSAADTAGTANSGLAKIQYSLNYDSANPALATWADLAGTSTWTGTITFPESASNKLYLRSIDNAGNVSGITDAVTVKVDATTPDLDVDSSTTVTAINCKSDVSFVLAASDSTSGLNEVSASFATGTSYSAIATSSTWVDKSGSTKTATLTIPKATLDAQYTADGTKKIYFKVSDMAGNISSVIPYTFTVDKTAPTGDVTSHAANTTVNKTITVAGTASDPNLSATTGTFWVWKPTSPGAVDASAIGVWESASSGIVSGTTSWTVSNFDTTKYASTSYDASTDTGFQLLVGYLASDTAGNTTYITRVLNVDQDSDRPVLQFSNLPLSNAGGAMSSSNPMWLTGTKTLYGIVTDDDGTSGLTMGIRYKFNTDTTFTTGIITCSNGSWSYTLPSGDGPYQLEFTVTDAKGAVFTSVAGTTGTALLATMKLTDGTTTLADKGSSAFDTILYIKEDTAAPDVGIEGVSTDAGAHWTGSSYSDIKLGGANHSINGTVTSSSKTFQLKGKASDANGIKKLTLVTSGLAGVADKTLTTTPDATSGSYTFTGIDCSQGTGTMTITVTATDNADNTKSSALSMSVDNTAPTVAVLNPSSTTTSSGKVTAYGTVDESPKEVDYAVSVSGTLSPDDSTSLSTWTNDTGSTASLISGKTGKSPYKQIKDASFSWYVYFDGDTDSSLTTEHSEILNTYLVNLGVTTQALLDANSFKSVVKLYVWIKVVDPAGNVTETPHLILLDPQGGRPKVTLNYPETNGVSLGGTVRLNGSATDDGSVNAVFVQLVSGAHTLVGYVPRSGAAYGTVTADVETGTYTTSVPTASDLDYMASIGTVYQISTYKATDATHVKWTAGDTLTDGSDWGLLASFSGSGWSLNINKNGELNPPGGSTNNVGIRVYATDSDPTPTKSVPLDRIVAFDADLPVISNLYLVQSVSPGYSAAKTASREYTDDMWVKGDWYLTGTANDSDQIKTLTIDGKDLVVDSVATSGSNWDTVISSDKKTVNFKYKLATGSDVGNLSFKMTAEDGANHFSPTKTVSVNYDNTAPVLVTSGKDYKIDPKVRQSNNFYTMSSQVTESQNQSGFARTAFYFLRRDLTAASSSNYTYTVFDPMISKDSAGNTIDIKNAIAESDVTGSTPDNTIVYKSGLYWKYKTMTRDSTNLSSLTLTSSDYNIHKGGLVEIGNALYTVDSVSGTSVTIKGSPESTYVAAYFALSLVVDNTITESSSGPLQSTSGYGYGYNTPLNDDGDRMIEGVSKSGTTWTWEANICSKNIPDGPIEIHYVVFDEAGNYTIGTSGNVAKATYGGGAAGYLTKEVADANNGNYVYGQYTYGVDTPAFVSNNAPRIAGVQVGTDLNNNGVIDAGEWNTSNAASSIAASFVTGGIYDVTKLGTTIELGSTTTPLLTAKGYTVIKPEIVGGNSDIYYSYSYQGGTTATVSGSNTNTKLGSGTTDYSLDTLSTINLQLGDLLKAGTTDTTLGASANVPFTFTIWDSTAGTKTCVNSQHADITLHMGVQLKDNIDPTASIIPFHWASSADNSLYGNSAKNGHIELESDWTLASGYLSTATSGTKDGDPKVSGQIVITGSAFDNRQLSALYISIPGMAGTGTDGLAGAVTSSDPGIPTTQLVNGVTYYLIATCSGGTWTEIDAFTARGFKFNVGTNTYDATGQKALWTFSWDTAKISGVAATDVKVQILALDQGVPVCASSSTGDATYKYLSIDGTTYFADPTYSNKRNSGYTATQTTSASPTAYYKMDVVPYISGVKTSLSTLKKTKPSVYDRTALGHYPVKSDLNAYFYGFNLVAAATVSDSAATPHTTSLGSADASTYSGYTVYPAAVSTFTSGAVSVTVNSVVSLNNANSNEAKGSYAGTSTSATGDYTVYSNYYNRQPNNDNNNNLTDDVVLDVWKVKNSARSHSGTLTEPIMRIVPTASDTASDKDVMRFAFTNGADYFSMASADDKVSYQDWQRNYADFNNVAFTYDSAGNSYGIATGLDTYPNGKATYAGRLTFVSSRWGASYTSGMSDNYYGYHKLRLEAIGIMYQAYVLGTPLTDDYIMDTRRFSSPTLATAVHSGAGTSASTSVYFAYYDKFQKQIRFRYGTFSSTTGSTETSAFTTNSTSLTGGGNFGQFIDQHAQGDKANNATTADPHFVAGTNDVARYAFDAARSDYSLIAGIDAKTKVDTGNAAGKYVAIDVVPDTSDATKDVVVAVWFDGSDLKYSYILDPTSGRNADQTHASTSGYWSTPKTIFTDGGKYCAIKVDANKGIHIAAQDTSNQDLKYAYLPSCDAAYDESTNAVTVDAYGIVGSQIQIDTQIEGGKVIPYISYYNGATMKPKMAYLVPQTTMDYTSAGADSTTEMLTGKWEVTLVPTGSDVQDDHMNIGLWKTTAGAKRTTIQKGTDNVVSGTGYSYGNGTANAVVGYAIVDGTQGYIETAQKQ